LQQTLDNFKEDALAAKGRHGEEGLILFMEGHRRRYEGLVDLKEELAAFDTDGLQHGREIEKLFDAAGIKTSGMDSWGPERVYDELKQATGVMSGALPHPDDEDEDEGPVVFNPRAAVEGKDGDPGLPALDGRSNDNDTLEAMRSLTMREGEGLDNPVDVIFTKDIDPESPWTGLTDLTDSVYIPNFKNFNDDSDWLQYYGQQWKFTEFYGADDPLGKLSLKDFISQLRARSDKKAIANEKPREKLDRHNKITVEIRNRVKERIILDASNSHSGSSFNLDKGDAWWDSITERVIEMATAPAAPRDTSAIAQEELFDTRAIWHNTKPGINMMTDVELASTSGLDEDGLGDPREDVWGEIVSEFGE